MWLVMPSGLHRTYGAHHLHFITSSRRTRPSASQRGLDKDFVSRSRGVDAVLQAFVVPTLRQMREGWGTPCAIGSGKVKNLGHPPTGS